MQETLKPSTFNLMKKWFVLPALLWSLGSLAQSPAPKKNTTQKKEEAQQLLAQLEKAVNAMDSALQIAFHKAEIVATDSTHLIKLKKSIVRMNKNVAETSEKIGRELEKLADDIERQLNETEKGKK